MRALSSRQSSPSDLERNRNASAPFRYDASSMVIAAIINRSSLNDIIALFYVYMEWRPVMEKVNCSRKEDVVTTCSIDQVREHEDDR